MTQQPPWPAGPPPEGQPVPYGQQPYGSLSRPYQPQATEPATTAPPAAPPAMGPAAPQAVHIEQFAPPKAPRGVIIGGILTGLIVLGLLVGAFFLIPRPGPTASPSQSASPARSASPSSTRSPNANGVEFETPDGIRGYWEVLSEEWSGSDVTLKVRIELDSGTLRYSFFAFDNSAGRAIEATSPRKQPGLTTGTLQSPKTLEGYITFQMPQRGPGSVYIASSSRSSLAALRIAG